MEKERPLRYHKQDMISSWYNKIALELVCLTMPNFETIVRITILSYPLLGSEIYLNKIIIKEGVNKREKSFGR